MKFKRQASVNEILDAFEKGRLKRTRNASAEIRMAREAAADYLRKNERINIRLSSPDLKLIKRRAAEEGLPYQTLIASVLHKFVTGRFSNAA